MIRKIIIVGMLLLAAFIFYQKFMATTLEPFFKQKAGKVDFLQKGVPNYKMQE